MFVVAVHDGGAVNVFVRGPKLLALMPKNSVAEGILAIIRRCYQRSKTLVNPSVRCRPCSYTKTAAIVIDSAL